MGKGVIMGNHIIIEPASKIREIARNTLSGNWKPVALVLFIYFLLTSGVGLILDQFFTYTYTLQQGIYGEPFAYDISYGSDIYDFFDQRTVFVRVDHVSSDLFQNQKIGRYTDVCGVQ